jgi:Histidine kinase-, DNA gyrase B-, and HSP90-like ATPase
MPQRQATLFDSGVMFGASFLADHAGQLMTDGRLAVTELVANAYDAGASSVRISWPGELGQEFSIEDDGAGMTPEEFNRRWRTLGYKREHEQGKFAEFPSNQESRTRKRIAFGQSGKGRHGAFCFANSYRIETWKHGTCLSIEVKLTNGGREPFEFGEPMLKQKGGHGTLVTAAVQRTLVDTDSLVTAIGSKFLVDPEFSILFNGTPLVLLDLDTANSTHIQVAGLGEIEIIEIDPETSDRTTLLRGITWWVQGRMVGSPSWDGLDSSGAILDGRTSVAKRLSYVIKADILKPHVKADWTGFHATEESIAVSRLARQQVIKQLEAHLAESRSSRKRQALSETAEALHDLAPLSRRVVGEFTDQVLAKCPSISHGDLTKAVTIFATMEKARTKYDLLAEIAACSPDDIDRWAAIFRRWTASDAEHVLGELEWRLRLIDKLEHLLQREHADELHELQPLFEHGLWIFGPEYESLHFRSNRSLVTVVRELLRSDPSGVSGLRPDFVALPDRSIGVYTTDGFDTEGEVSGIAKVLIVELKHGGATLTRKEVAQPEDYVAALRSGNYVQASTRFDAFVLGSKLAPDGVGDRRLEEPMNAVIRPMTYERLLKRAHARTFNLLNKVRRSFPEAKPDSDVEAAVSENRSLFDGVSVGEAMSAVPPIGISTQATSLPG